MNRCGSIPSYGANGSTSAHYLLSSQSYGVLMVSSDANLATAEGILAYIQTMDFPYYIGAVFPSELAYFLFKCEQQQIEHIVESGRGLGYSTAILASYGELKGVSVTSIDWEADADLAAQCRENLARFKGLDLQVGDTFQILPSLLGKNRTALLIDGPKYNEAIYLSSAACAIGNVRVVAHHNTQPGYSWHTHFAKRFPNAKRFEDSELMQAENLEDFKEWEFDVTKDTPMRDSRNTSLIVSAMDIDTPTLKYLHMSDARHTFVSWGVYLMWKIGLRVPLGRIMQRLRTRYPNRFFPPDLPRG